MIRGVLVVLALLAAGCKSPTEPDTVVVGMEFTLKAGQSITLPDGGWMLFNRLVSDSRCPIDAICVTAGDAVIELVFQRGHVTAELHTDLRNHECSTRIM